MKCHICGGLLPFPSYRQLYPHFNFPAHSVRDWDYCKTHLLERNLHPIYDRVPTYLTVSPQVSADHKEMVSLLSDPVNSFDLLMRIDELGVLLANVFNDAELTEPEVYLPAETQLDNATYQKLVAHEIETNTQFPSLLKDTSTEILKKLETGGFSIHNPFYYGTIPTGRSFQSVRIPIELSKALRQPWISRDHALERIFMAFAEELVVSEKNEDIAYLVTKNDIRPSTIRRKAKGAPVSATVNYMPLPNLPHDKRRAIRKGLQALDVAAVSQIARELGKPKEGRKLTTARVAYEDNKKIKSLARELRLPAYKVVTALLIFATHIKV